MRARMIVSNQGGYITGGAGCGKTHFTSIIKELIREEDPDAQIVSMALTHVAARLQGGCTVNHALHKFAKIRDAWIFIDEASQIPLSTMGELSRWGYMGCKFVIIEDRVGQFLPIFDTWNTDIGLLPQGTVQ